MPITLVGRFDPGVKSQLQPYRIQTWSISATTRREWSEQFWIYFGSEYENVDIYDLEIETESALRQELGITERRKLFIGAVRDSRRDKFMPKNGSLTTYLAEYVGGFLGGDASFSHLEFSWARYQRTLGIAVYATRFKVGLVREFGDSRDVPSTDRFYLGGANSIRGFEENSIGPRRADGGNDGANLIGIFNQELRYPLIWKFWGTFFTDFGNGWRDIEEITLNSILFSYGVGIQFISPAGPIRLDLAHRTESDFFSEGDRLHFTILYAF
jgi:outer membrane protein insertion porin family